MNEMLPDTISNGILFNVSALPQCEKKDTTDISF